MATLSPDVTAAVASLQARWGAAAPRITDGALALAPRRPWRHSPMSGHVPSRAGTDDRSSAPASRPSTRSWGPAACPDRPASRSAATARAAGRRSSCGSPRRPRRPARSSPGWTSRAASTRSRPSPAASGSNGSSSSPRRRSTRGSPSVARCWPGARWTCSSSTCPAAGWRPRTAPLASPTGSAGWRRSPGGRRRSSSCSSRRGWPADRAALCHRRRRVDRPASRARPAVVDPPRARHRRPADGGARRPQPLRPAGEAGDAPDPLRGRRRARRLPPPRRPPHRPGPRDPPRTDQPRCDLLHLHRPHLPLELARARASELLLPDRSAHPGRPAVGSGPGHRREPGGPGAGRPARDAARERPSARP